MLGFSLGSTQLRGRVLMGKDIEFFDATPDRRLLVDIGAANYTVPQAIAELVANCMDAKVEIDEFQVAPIEIEILVGDESVAIIDNGQGMTRAILGEAMRLSAIMDAVTGNTRVRNSGIFPTSL